jgi:hypothetical protein
LEGYAVSFAALLIQGPVLPFPAVPGAAVSAPAFVQDTSSAANGLCYLGTTCSAVAITTTTGHLLKVTAYYVSTTTFGSITDTCGTSGGASNTYTAAASETASYNKAKSFYTLVGYGKSCIVTFNYTTAVGSSFIKVTEIAGVNQTTPVAGTQWAIQYQQPLSAGATLSAGSITTTQNNAYIQCDSVDENSVNDTWTQGSGFTLHGTGYDGTVYAFAGESQALATAGAINGSFTASGTATGIYITDCMAVQHP